MNALRNRALQRWTYPALAGLLVGVMVAGLTFRIAARDELTASADGGFELATPGEDGTAAGDGVAATDDTGAESGTGLATDGAGDGSGLDGTGAVGGTGGAGGTGRPGTGGGGAGSGKLTASDVGVSATTIKIGVVLLDLGGAAQLGAAVPGYDIKTQEQRWRTFIDDQNARGGILGRKIEPHFIAVDPVKQHESRQACLRFTEEIKVFAVFAGGGMANGGGDQCIAIEHRTLDITDSTLPTSTHQQARGLIIGSGAHGNRFMAAWANGLHRLELVQGKKIGILADDADGKNMVENGLEPALKRLGHNVVYTAYVTNDPGAGPSQVGPHVLQMRQAGVDTVLMATAFFNATAFVNAADRQGWRPKYSVSDYQGLPSATLSAGMPESYQGTIAISYYGTANRSFRRAKDLAAEDLCLQRWEQLTGEKFPPDHENIGPTVGVCSRVDFLVTAATEAGTNLTRAGFSNAVQTMTDYSFGGLGGRFGPGKLDYNDLVRPMIWAPKDGSEKTNCAGDLCWNEHGRPFDPSQP